MTFCLADADVIHPLKSPSGILNGKSTVSSITDSKFHHAPKAPTSPETPAACPSTSATNTRPIPRKERTTYLD